MAANAYAVGGARALNPRRESFPGDMANHSIPGGPGRGGYPMQAGRGGRAVFQGQQFSHQTPFPGPPTYRGQPNQPNQPNQRATQNMAPQNMTPFQARPQHHPNSPNLAARSPAMMNANPAAPQMPHMPMVPGQPYLYQGYQGYPQVNRHISSSNSPSARGKAGKGKGRGRNVSNFNNSERDWDRLAAQRNKPKSRLPDPALLVSPLELPVDLSPASGNFERFERILTAKKQGYVQFQSDPSLQAMFEQQRMQSYQPVSPRPSYSQAPGPHFMQQQYSNQGQPMSRTSSQVSTSERPTSSLGQPPTPSMPPVAGHSHTASHATNSLGSNGAYKLPRKGNAALVIRNEDGAIVNPSTAIPARATPSPVKAGTPPAPDSRSRSVSTVGASQARAESANGKSGEEKKKAMQDAVAKKIAEVAKLKQDKEDAEQKALKEKEEAEARENEGAQQKDEADISVEGPAATIADAQTTGKSHAPGPETSEPTTVEDNAEEQSAVDDQKEPEVEDEFEKLARQMEAEEAAREEEEKAKEAAYQAKKQAEHEAQKQKEADEEAAYYANLKQAEREAEEAEEARQRKKTEAQEGEDQSRAMEEVVKAEHAPTPPSLESPTIRTPAESGAATPVSDFSMGPPAKNAAASRRERPAALTLEISKQIEPPQPSAAMRALRSARFLENPASVEYPNAVASPNPALNKNAPADRKFKYNKEFLMQFEKVFTDKPSPDWDAKIRDTIGDGNESSARPSTSRTPSTMSARSTSNRPSVMQGFGGMGTFNAPPRAGPANLPPGTTSAERFALSNQSMGGQRGAPMQNNPFAFGRPPGVSLVGQSVSRNSSSNALAGQIPSSPRGGGSQRGPARLGSKRDKISSKKVEEENRVMPLTASGQVKPILPSSTGWKPRSVGQAAGAGPAPDGHMAPDVVQRKVKGLLNKMTPEKFERISDQILEIAAQSQNETDGRTLRQVIQLTFEKATDEAHWASTYALFCKRMLESMSPSIKDENIKDKHGNVVTGGALFRKYLLNRCQEEFERGWKVNMPPKPEGQTEEAALLSEEYYIAAAAKRRGLGLVKFIGELYKLNMLTERIMHECIKKLLELDESGPDESEVESLVSLLNTVGLNLEQSERGPALMNVYFERIASIMDHPDLPSRLRFKLLDLIDLRKQGWQSKTEDKGPKLLAQIHADALRQQQQQDAERQSGNRGGGSGGRLPRTFSSGRGMPPPDYTSNNVGTDDLKRLGARTTRNSSNPSGPTLGPSGSLFSGRTNSGRRGLGPGSLFGRGEDSGTTSRTGTPPQREKDRKEDGGKSSTNAFR